MELRPTSLAGLKRAAENRFGAYDIFDLEAAISRTSTGWVAVIEGVWSETFEERTLFTGGYETRKQLVSDLLELGIPARNITGTGELPSTQSEQR